MARKARKTKDVNVETFTHPADKRKNIPTAELQSYLREEEAAPKAMRYPRNPDLDPQLVWRGKDEQDSEDLVVDAVPIYIQEKLHPKGTIDDLRRISKGGVEPQADLFADFNGLPDAESKLEFYEHDANWSNRMILGDSLLVMNSLAEKEGLKGQVQMIYIDPPYGIKFGSNWQVSTRRRDVKDGKAEDVCREPEVIKAFRDTWELGTHSYLAYLRDRLIVARDLLTESGSAFVQIGDENVHVVRCIMDEVFGGENFVSIVVVKKTGLKGSRYLDSILDYVLWYGKNFEHTKYRVPLIKKEMGVGKGTGERYDQIQLQDGSHRALTAEEKANPKTLLPLIDKGARPFQLTALISESSSASTTFTVEIQGKQFYRTNWKTNDSGFKRLIQSERVEIGKKTLRYVRYFDDFKATAIGNFWDDTGVSDKIYVVQTSSKVIERCLLMTTDPGDLVLDPTCGSGTTAHVAEQWGRRWITIDTSRVAVALARTRLMAAKYPYYLLKDSPDGAQKEGELTGRLPKEGPFDHDIRQGFVYERAPHITLKSIANNAEIDVIYERWQEELEPLREQLNESLGETWEEWEIPREADDDWPKAVKEVHTQWWEGRRKRQEEIDASIALNANVVLLYDRLYEAKNVVRVSGPFTVESLSPHRVLPTDEDDEILEALEQEAAEEGRPLPPRTRKPVEAGEDDFVSVVLENLKAAGVQNTKKKERLVFTSVKPWAGGSYIHAEGRYMEGDKERRAAICIGPEYGTVSYQLVRAAAREAVDLFDVLVVCGFAFEPQVGEDTMSLGRLAVLKAHMNQDLHMAEHLKKTGAGNLFVVFGEPEIEIRDAADGEFQVEIKGVDVFDPTTGEVRSGSTEDIACWFIDTDYDEESFFVRHAYFLGAKDPYERLKRTLKAEINEEAWATLHSNISRPFPKPQSGKIAVKVINHYGDEVLKVYDVV